MITRRTLCAGLAVSALTPQLDAAVPSRRLDVGLELYSLRAQMQRDVPGTLALVRSLGFDQVEVPALYGLTALEFRRALDQAGLKATAMVAGYDDLRGNLAAVQRDLDTLGARWALLGWIPHGEAFTRADADRAATDMNAWGKALAGSGHEFAYHVHGYEFQPEPQATLFDVLARTTDPVTVKFQMDTFWIVWPGQDCVRLLERYPARFRLLHLKDLRKGVPTGDLSGTAPAADSVALGEGIVPWKEVLRVARQQHVAGYFIEDESPNALQQIPQSLRFLRQTGMI